ncbi:SpoIIAA family protein [Tautonia marina]|uniref:STAS/SEC14 domain-containing protein n=1 Tax=Tautonia marina TaxID=2653855 RepID=UPI001260A763|nr:STAS/SEC14 domain-containing protein [Tautonia marina]
MIEQIQTDSPKLLAFRLSGKLHDEDYRSFVPTIETALAAAGGKVSLLAQFEDFHGWDLHAAWDDLSLGVKHYSDFERIALVGDKKWQEWMTRFCKPFTRANVKYFDASEVEAAWAWLGESD